MRATEVASLDLFNAGRWRVELFTDDNSANIMSRWPSVRLDDLAEPSNTAIDPSEFGEKQFYYIGLENVESITGDPVDLRKRSKGEIKSRSKVFDRGNVLYGRLRPNLRKVFLSEGEYVAGLCSTEFLVLRPLPERILPQVLRALLASEPIAKQLTRLQIGAALPRVSASDFFSTKVPLPPMEVQQKMLQDLELLRQERLKLKSRLQNLPGEFDRIVFDLALS